MSVPGTNQRHTHLRPNALRGLPLTEETKGAPARGVRSASRRRHSKVKRPRPSGHDLVEHIVIRHLHRQRVVRRLHAVERRVSATPVGMGFHRQCSIRALDCHEEVGDDDCSSRNTKTSLLARSLVLQKSPDHIVWTRLYVRKV
jgi:hypothetical protein